MSTAAAAAAPRSDAPDLLILLLNASVGVTGPSITPSHSLMEAEGTLFELGLPGVRRLNQFTLILHHVSVEVLGVTGSSWTIWTSTLLDEPPSPPTVSPGSDSSEGWELFSDWRPKSSAL